MYDYEQFPDSRRTNQKCTHLNSECGNDMLVWCTCNPSQHQFNVFTEHRADNQKSFTKQSRVNSSKKSLSTFTCAESYSWTPLWWDQGMIFTMFYYMIN